MMGKQVRHRRKRISIRDVGRHAGVSHSTVSRVILGDSKVSDETRMRVNAAIESLNYVPSKNARLLVKSVPVTLGMPILANTPNIEEIVSGVVQQAILRGARLISRHCETRSQAAFVIGELKACGAEAIILIAPLCDDPLILGEIAAGDIPAILVGSDGPVEGYPSILINEYEAAAELTDYLLSRGHRKIGFIQGAPEKKSSSKIFLGYVAAMRRANVEISPRLVEQGASSYRGGLHAAERMLEAVPDVTAIFASSDEMAAAAIAVAQKRQIDVPGQLSVVGFGDTAIASALSPGLTTVHFSSATMGREAVNLVINSIHPREGRSDPRAQKQKVLDHKILFRDSTRPEGAKRMPRLKSGA